MFGKLKDKLKGALQKFSKEVEEEAEIIEQEEAQESEQIPEPVLDKREEQEAEVKEELEESDSDEKEVKQEEPETETTSTTVEVEATKEEKELEDEEPKETPAAELPSQKEKPVVDESKVTEEKKVIDEPIVEDEVQEVEEEAPQEKKKRGFFGFGRKKEEKTLEEEPVVEESPKQEVREEKKGLFSKLTKITLSEEKFEDIFWELEITLLENNVAVEVIEKIKGDLKEALTGEKMQRKSVEEIITDTLKKTITEILSVQTLDLLAQAEKKNSQGEPLIIAMIGVNGSGKTTTLAKLAHKFKQAGKSVVVAASDTFRAAAIDQLEEHTTNLGVKLIKHDYHADPAAVAFDAVKHAKAKGIDIVLIDSAGRLHSNDNLMNELKKLIRINQPDIKIFVGEAITGNDCVEQAKLFDQAVGIDAIILAKADVDEKGGASISASYVTGKPVIYIGTGQTYDDLETFKPELVIEKLGL